MPTVTTTTSDVPISPLVVAVVGPTATGKSALAVALALALDGEIVNADASALYRGMDIGTAKPTLAERRGIPHHQLDVLEVTQEASVAAYQQGARADVEAIIARGRLPILAGGSGLYVRAALDHLDIPPTDPAVRARLEAEATADPDGPSPVSYTHLDVYKRQVQESGGCHDLHHRRHRYSHSPGRIANPRLWHSDSACPVMIAGVSGCRSRR